jgi:acyl CoA:acetate/3-ketoacid CoA transferase
LPIVVLGTFASRSRVAIENGNLRILEPDTSLLVERVEQVTFSSE